MEAVALHRLADNVESCDQSRAIFRRRAGICRCTTQQKHAGPAPTRARRPRSRARDRVSHYRLQTVTAEDDGGDPANSRAHSSSASLEDWMVADAAACMGICVARPTCDRGANRRCGSLVCELVLGSRTMWRCKVGLLLLPAYLCAWLMDVVFFVQPMHLQSGLDDRTRLLHAQVSEWPSVGRQSVSPERRSRRHRVLQPRAVRLCKGASVKWRGRVRVLLLNLLVRLTMTRQGECVCFTGFTGAACQRSK